MKTQERSKPRKAWSPDDQLWEQWRAEASARLSAIVTETCELLATKRAPGKVNMRNTGPRYPAWPITPLTVPITRLSVEVVLVPELKSIVVMPTGASTYGTASAGLVIDEIVMPLTTASYDRIAANSSEIALEHEIYRLAR